MTLPTSNQSDESEAAFLQDFFSAMDDDTPDIAWGVSTEQKDLPTSDHPDIAFIRQPDWQSFVANLRYDDKEHRRLIDIEERIVKAGGCMRKLQTLPPQWEVLIDLFEGMFPNFASVADFLRDYFALHSVGDSRIHFPPLLLVGEAGIGKTEAARWLANHLGVPFCTIDMASAQTGSALSGSEKFWTNTRVGHVFETLAYEEFANPIIMLDELDKVLGDSRFDPFAPLYTLLEPSSAKTFIDLSIGDFAINASHINWIATANSLDSIPQPIQTRVTVLHIEKPTADQAQSIAKNIYKRLLADASWGGFFEQELNTSVIDALILHPPRTIKMVLVRALGAAIRGQRNFVTKDDLMLPKNNTKSGIGFMA